MDGPPLPIIEPIIQVIIHGNEILAGTKVFILEPIIEVLIWSYTATYNFTSC